MFGRAASWPHAPHLMPPPCPRGAGRGTRAGQCATAFPPPVARTTRADRLAPSAAAALPAHAPHLPSPERPGSLSPPHVTHTPAALRPPYLAVFILADLAAHPAHSLEPCRGSALPQYMHIPAANRRSMHCLTDELSMAPHGPHDDMSGRGSTLPHMMHSPAARLDSRHAADRAAFLAVHGPHMVRPGSGFPRHVTHSPAALRRPYVVPHCISPPPAGGPRVPPFWQPCTFWPRPRHCGRTPRISTCRAAPAPCRTRCSLPQPCACEPGRRCIRTFFRRMGRTPAARSAPAPLRRIWRTRPMPCACGPGPPRSQPVLARTLRRPRRRAPPKAPRTSRGPAPPRRSPCTHSRPRRSAPAVLLRRAPPRPSRRLPPRRQRGVQRRGRARHQGRDAY